jgi:putative transposase
MAGRSLIKGTGMGEAGRPLAELSEKDRDLAWSRWLVIAPAVEQDVALTQAAAHAGVPISTARRWLARYRQDGLAGLTRRSRSDHGRRRTQPELVSLIQALALRRPRLTAASITRRVGQVAREQRWSVPAYSTVAGIIAAIDPPLMTLAQDGSAAWRDRSELVYRREADRPNEIWQADHTELDILILDSDGSPARPWLTLILDDHSRAVAGYTVFLGAPSALNLSLALRQAIWRKPDAAWPVHGLPDALHVDHGSDFTSRHIEQVCADLHVRLLHSTIARPQGRGKVERLFGTLTTELLPGLPGHLVHGVPATSPALTIAQLDQAIRDWVLGVYHPRVHRETRVSPHARWSGGGWLPRMPDTLEALDLLLVMVAVPRVVHRDGIHFAGLRYLDPIFAEHVGRSITIRYDPRDISEIRVFRNDRFLCRAISPQHAGETITLKDIQAARTRRRRELREQLNQRRSFADALPLPAFNLSAEIPLILPTPSLQPTMTATATALKTYEEE